MVNYSSGISRPLAPSGSNQSKGIKGKLISIKTKLGSLVHLTGVVENLKKDLGKLRSVIGSEFCPPYLSCAIHVEKFVNAILNADVVKSLFTQGPEVGSHILGVLQGINVLSLYNIPKKLKTEYGLYKNAVTASETAKSILGGLAAIGKVFSAADNLIKSINSFSEMTLIPVGSKLAKLAPSLGSIGLILSTAAASVKIWDLKGTFHVANKVKEKCRHKLILNMENQLRQKISESGIKEGEKDKLINKLNNAIIDSHKTSEKKLYLLIKKELTKKPLSLEALEQLCAKLSDGSPLSGLKEKVEKLRVYQDRINCLKDPLFIEDCEKQTARAFEMMDKLTSEMLAMTRRGLTRTSEESEAVQTFKKDLKNALSSSSQDEREFIEEIDRNSKLVYLDVVAHYKEKKIGKALDVNGKQFQASALKVADQFNHLKKAEKFTEADDFLTSHYKELKGRIKYRKKSEGKGLFIDAIGMGSSAIAISSVYGAITAATVGTIAAATAITTGGIALGVAAAVFGLVIAYKKYNAKQKFEENMGMTEANKLKEWDQKLEQFKLQNGSFFAHSPGNQELLDRISFRIESKNVDSLMNARFTALPDDEEGAKAAKSLNDLINEMNEWTLNKPLIQKRNYINQQKVRLEKNLSEIDEKQLPREHKALLGDLKKKLSHNDFDLSKISFLSVSPGSKPETQIAIERTNQLIQSMMETHVEGLERDLDIYLKRKELLLNNFEHEFPNENLEELAKDSKKISGMQVKLRLSVLRFRGNEEILKELHLKKDKNRIKLEAHNNPDLLDLI